MSTAKTTAVFPTHFILRRLHSLSGLFPVGVFLLEHIFTNAFSLAGPEAYNKRIESLQSLPFVVLIEIFFIFAPILFHALYGLAIIYEGKSNLHQYPHAANWRYTLQRFTGLVGLVFVSYHVYATRVTSYLTQTPMSYQWMQDLLADPVKLAFYLVGSISLLFHFANGLWSFLIVWGVTISPVSQKLSLRLCMTLFAVLTLVNILILLNFAYPPETRPELIGTGLNFIRTWFFGTL